MAGSIVHIEIKVTNMARAKKFYTKLFGWKFQSAMPGYEMFSAGKGLGGALDKVKAVSAKDGTLPYIEVKSIDQTLLVAKKLRAKTILARTEIGGNMGSMARFRDSEGNVIGLWSKK